MKVTTIKRRNLGNDHGVALMSAPARDPDADPAPNPDTDPAQDPDTDPAPNPDTDPAPNPDTDRAQDPDADRAQDPDADPAPNPDADPAQDPDTDRAPDPDADPAQDPDTDPAPNSVVPDLAVALGIVGSILPRVSASVDDEMIVLIACCSYIIIGRLTQQRDTFEIAKVAPVQ
jgi:hypothetical protein